jgi:sulfite exporter TauE/SafE/copper chaperone CopZ
MKQTYIFHVNDMHCHSCVLLTESELAEHPSISSVKSSLETKSVEIQGDFNGMPPKNMVKELSQLLSQHSLSIESETSSVNWKEFVFAVPIAFVFGLLFFLLQKFGIVNLVNTGDVGYGTAFVVGIIASLSTCMAVVGGLVLSMSATFAHEGDKVRPQMLFHVGRIVSFFVLGGVIGAVGAAFQLGAIETFILGLIVGLVMLVLGINLLDVFHWTKRLQPSMPKLLSQKAFSVTKFNHTFTPALVGIATFFLPCGFTQSMQIYALSTGSFLKGALTMLAFALGTLPVLALVSFSSFTLKSGSRSGIFFKSAGLIVIMFAVFNILNSLVAIGWIQPIFNF